MHLETYPVKAKGTRLWLTRQFYRDFGKPPGTQALQDALGVLEARALFDGEERPVHVRVAEHEGAIYIDLANDRWEAVEITEEGWKIVSDPPIRFRRPKGMQPFPYPIKGGKVDELKRFVNVKDERGWRLLVAWLVQALRPSGPYLIMILQGEQGSAKSTLARILRALTDPSTTPARTIPRGEHDLMITASNSWVLVFDNLSGLPPWLSDAICRVSTGGGFGTRTLYENDEETLFDAMRPVALNGITDVATRPDLLDRAVVVELPQIPDEDRKDEKKLWEEFEEALPRILGGLFDAVSVALREFPNVDLDSKPRMADVALWVTAAESGLGWERGAFMESYAGSRDEINELALEGNPVAVAIVKLMEGRDEWIGTAGELLKELGKRVDDDIRRYKTWPKQPQHLSRQLKRLAPVLRTEGIEIEDLPRESGERKKRLFKNKPVNDRHERHERHAGPEPHNKATSEDDGGDDGVTVTVDEGLEDRHHEKPVEMPDSAGRDNHDGNDDEIHLDSKGVFITTPEDLEDLIPKIKQAETVAFDTETYPQDDTNAALDPRRGRVRLLQIAAAGAAGVVDIRQVDPAPLLEALRGRALIAHNAKFDLSFLKNQFGYEHDGAIVDTQVLDAVIYYAAGPRLEKDGWEGFPKDKPHRRSLAACAADYLNIDLDKEAQTSDFSQDELSEKQIEYALKDVEILLLLKDAMMEKAKELGLEHVVDLESRFAPALAYCEANGFALDIEGWREQALRAGEEAERIKEECDALAPLVPEGEDREGWNWSSTKQLGTALEIFGATMPRHPTESYKTDDATLKGITSPDNAARLAQAVLRYRGAKKKSSTWGLRWFEPPKKKPHGKKFDKGHQIIVDGRVFSSFQQVVKTGRTSSSGPNLQNIPPEMRKLFVAPPGRKLLIADYKQIELVTAAVVSGEEKLLEAFRRGDDVHSLTARGILESDPDRGGRPVTEDEVRAFRPKAKMVSFGILYGITAKGLAGRIESNFEVHTSVEDAQGMIDRFLDTYPALKRWYLEESRKAKQGDDITYTLIGRRRLLDVSKGYYGNWRANSSLRLNTPIQGSAGDGFKAALALLWERRRECLGNPRMVNMVHDEAVLEIDSEHVDAGKGWLEKNMLEGMREVLGSEAPVSVEINVADNWGEKE